MMTRTVPYWGSLCLALATSSASDAQPAAPAGQAAKAAAAAGEQKEKPAAPAAPAAPAISQEDAQAALREFYLSLVEGGIAFDPQLVGKPYHSPMQEPDLWRHYLVTTMPHRMFIGMSQVSSTPYSGGVRVEAIRKAWTEYVQARFNTTPENFPEPPEEDRDPIKRARYQAPPANAMRARPGATQAVNGEEPAPANPNIPDLQDLLRQLQNETPPAPKSDANPPAPKTDAKPAAPPAGATQPPANGGPSLEDLLKSSSDNARNFPSLEQLLKGDTL